MRKLLVFMLVLGMAATVNAALSLFVEHEPAPDEFTMQVCDTIKIGLASDNTYSYAVYFVIEDPDMGEWASCPNWLPGSGKGAHICIYDPFYCLCDDVWCYLENMVYDPADIMPGEHVNVDFYCKAVGDCTITLLDYDEETVLDSLTIHQVSESMNMVSLDAVPGVATQGSQYEIFPTDPTIDDIIYFTGSTDAITNYGCFLCEFDGSPPTLIIDNIAKTIELKFYPIDDCVCIALWDPVYGYVEGKFGPLSDGDWLFFCDHPSSSFSIPFHVSSIKILEPNGGESLPAGSIHTIKWVDYRNDVNCPGNYVILLTCHESDGRILMGVQPAPQVCSYDWILPAIDSNECSITITDANDPNISDVTNAAFTIYQCQLTSDITGDCVIDFADFAALVAEWLDCGNPFDPNCVQ